MRRLLAIISVILVLSIVGIFTWFTVRFFFTPISVTNQTVVFSVSPGTAMPQLARDLYRQGILKDPHYFLLLAKLRGDLTHIKVGEYQLDPGTTPAGLLNKLVKGEILLRKITFVEGWTFQQMMAAINAHPTLSHTLQGQSPEVIMATIGHPGENPEGMFYPDTYLFSFATKDTKILTMAYDLMQKKLQKAWKMRAPELTYSSTYQALIVASMIEKETAQAKERPMIAGVILRRLQKQMPLQIDATVIYGLGPEHSGALRRTDLTVDNPYNTYTRRGLPPTPIGMPSEKSIQAALNPSGGKALFYVAKGDGTHVFSENFQTHRSAVQRYFETRREEVAELDKANECSVAGNLMINYWQIVGGIRPVRMCYTMPPSPTRGEGKTIVKKRSME